MNTTKRYFTGHIGVKIACFVLIPAAIFMILSTIFGAAQVYARTNVNPEVIFSNHDAEQEFFDNHMGSLFYDAAVVTYYVIEDDIIKGNRLKWVSETHQEYDDEIKDFVDVTYQVLVSNDPAKANYTTYGTLRADNVNRTNPMIAQMEQEAIRSQLLEFSAALARLSEIEGLYYVIEIESGSRNAVSAISYVSGPPSGVSADAFMQLPVFLVSSYRGDEASATSSHVYNGPRYGYMYDWHTYPFYLSAAPYDEAINGEVPEYYGASISLGFDDSVVGAFADGYRSARTAYVNSLTIIALCAAVALAAFVVLMMGAGRRYVNVKLKMKNVELGDEGDEENSQFTATPAETLHNSQLDDPTLTTTPHSTLHTPHPSLTLNSQLASGSTLRVKNGVHFLPIDRLFLDIGLFLVAGWTTLLILLFYTFADYTWHTDINMWNAGAVNIAIGAMAVLILCPMLLWLTSLAKHIKAGKFWHHTLIYFVPSRLWRGGKALVKSLWSGMPLMGKIALIVFAAFIMFLFLSIMSALWYDAMPAIIFGVPFCAVIAFFLLRYARRIHKLDLGAKAISNGAYGEPPIDVGKGELGSIANSINNISSGINNAVEQRMKSERLKTELITNVSHDIRTPLTSIITYIDLLKNEGLDCEKAPEYLDVLAQKSARLKTLTDDLFEAAKASTGNIEVNLTQLDIVSLINQVQGELDSLIGGSGLDLRLNLPESLSVWADGKLMWRVIENLLNNALKYSIPGSRIYMDAYVEGAYARIDIKNISAIELGSDFDPSELTERFKRGDESRADGGSGLGLSIVQSFVTAQHGTFTITVDGDLFKATVYIPLA